MSQQPTPNRPQEEEINLREELEKYLRYWPWFVLGVILCVLVGLVYLKFTTAQYSTTASIIIKDEKGKNPASEMAAFADLGLLGGMSTSSIENEIGILKSKTLMTQTIKALNLNITYFEEEGLKSKELYNKRPFKVVVLQLEEEKLQKNIKEELGNSFYIRPETDESFQLVNTETGESIKGKFGTSLQIGFATITIEKTGIKPEEDAGEFGIQFHPLESVIGKYRNGVQVNLTDKNSSLLELSLVVNSPKNLRN